MVCKLLKAENIKFVERNGSHQRPEFREKRMHREDQRWSQSSLLGNQDRHRETMRRMLENSV